MCIHKLVTNKVYRIKMGDCQYCTGNCSNHGETRIEYEVNTNTPQYHTKNGHEFDRMYQ